jgi:hypothetical protein
VWSGGGFLGHTKPSIHFPVSVVRAAGGLTRDRSFYDHFLWLCQMASGEGYRGRGSGRYWPTTHSLSLRAGLSCVPASHTVVTTSYPHFDPHKLITSHSADREPSRLPRRLHVLPHLQRWLFSHPQSGRKYLPTIHQTKD